MIEIKHGFNSLVADDPDAAAAGEVLPSHWNAAHQLTVPESSLVGNSALEPGAAEAVSIGNGLSLVAGVLSLLGVPVFFQAEQPQQDGPFVWASSVGESGFKVIAKDALGVLRALDVGDGWAQYLDTQYTAASPFTIADGVTSTLPNNAGNNITSYLPNGFDLYDPVTQKLTPAAVGDYNAITIRFNAEASATSAYLEFGIDTGNPAGPIFQDFKVFPKGAGVPHPFTFTCLGFSLNNFKGNGGRVKITAVGGDVEVYDINYHFARLVPA